VYSIILDVKYFLTDYSWVITNNEEYGENTLLETRIPTTENTKVFIQD